MVLEILVPINTEVIEDNQDCIIDGKYKDGALVISIAKESFKETTISIRHQEQTRWMFTCAVRIRHYGKVGFAIIYDNPDKQ